MQINSLGGNCRYANRQFGCDIGLTIVEETPATENQRDTDASAQSQAFVLGRGSCSTAV